MRNIVNTGKKTNNTIDLNPVMLLTSLPDDVLLLISRFLSSDDLLALSQSFHAALVLSQTSILWWCHDITGIASHLDEIKNLREYRAVDFRLAALKARRTWASFDQPGARRKSAFRTPIEDNRYEGLIPSGLPFYFSLGTFGEDRQTCLVCRDLGNDGEVIGSYKIPTSNGYFETKSLAVVALDQETALVAILSQGQHSWYSPNLHLVKVYFLSGREDDSPSLTAEFDPILDFAPPRDWTPDDRSRVSIRLPKCFHITRDVVYWVQDMIDTTSKQTYVSPLVTVVKLVLETIDDQLYHRFGRWTCGRGQDLYTIGATIAANHVIVISSYVAPRAFVAPLSVILARPFNPESLYSPASIYNSMFYLPKPSSDTLSGLRFEFDSEIEPATLPVSTSSNIPPNSSTIEYKLRAVALVNPSSVARSTTQVWWYTSSLRVSTTSTGESTASLFFHPPGRGTSYSMYISRYGLKRGLLWCASLGPNSVLFLERSGAGHWPILRSGSAEIELFDALSGVACAFSDPLGDFLPCMSVSWFKGKFLKPKRSL